MFHVPLGSIDPQGAHDSCARVHERSAHFHNVKTGMTIPMSKHGTSLYGTRGTRAFVARLNGCSGKQVELRGRRDSDREFASQVKKRAKALGVHNTRPYFILST